MKARRSDPLSTSRRRRVPAPFSIATPRLLRAGTPKPLLPLSRRRPHTLGTSPSPLFFSFLERIVFCSFLEEFFFLIQQAGFFFSSLSNAHGVKLAQVLMGRSPLICRYRVSPSRFHVWAGRDTVMIQFPYGPEGSNFSMCVYSVTDSFTVRPPH